MGLHSLFLPGYFPPDISPQTFPPDISPYPCYSTAILQYLFNPTLSCRFIYVHLGCFEKCLDYWTFSNSCLINHFTKW